ncbi:hypothetical protein EXIGLDRAFT_632426 [Exidia glandulosa HHB12029]|uniref:DUF6589 domain-containing protein n=1 Tax=Exidia glandulosa HHB12029 TaxID=1314781 RepID=A0A166NIJ8_EXIGL|nr:hypothetical protein EXIGLDRAFT_632426 [Exidia glandulosa HHB12029]
MLSQFSAKAISEAQAVVSRGAFMVPSDNIRFNVHVESQRVDNQSQGVNCTAMTVVQLPDKFIDMVQHFDKRSIPRLLTPGGTLQEIRWKDLLDMDALRSIHPFKVHLVLSALFSVRELADHPLRFDPLLQRPAAISALPHGPEHKVKYWPLGTAQIDQSSYEGNALVIQEVLRQLDLDTAEHEQRIALNGVIPFAGDLLTGQRMKGLKSLLSEDDNGFDRLEWLLPVHGFFHNRMNLAYAIFHNHRGNSAGDGFAREINVLNRHGLTAKIKSPNVHTLDEFLLHFWTASTLDNWIARTALVDQRLEARIIANSDLMLLQLERFAIKHGDVGLLDTLCSPLAIFFKGGGHGNYGNDMLDYIQWRKYESTPELRDLIRNCWLVNTQGHPDSFFPVDELQEHINREQREWHTRAGSNFSIDYLKKVTPAIPALAATIKHMAQHFDMLYRSHVHKSPESQADIRLMAKRFRKRKTSEYVAGRTIKESVNKPDNHSVLGTALLQKEATWKKAFKERMLFLQHRSTLQNFESPEELELAVRMQELRLENTLDS